MSARDHLPLRRFRHAKRPSATSLKDALAISVDWALEKNSRGIKRVAALMGENPDTLYKWLGSGRLPANLIPVFENACGCHFVTEYLGHAAHKLVVDMPTGKAVREIDVVELQVGFADAMALLIRHWQGQATAEETVAALTQTMGGLAWQRENVGKGIAPELPLFGDEE